MHGWRRLIQVNSFFILLYAKCVQLIAATNMERIGFVRLAVASGYGSGLLVQTAAKMRDDFDAPAMLAAEAQHQQRFAAFVAAARLVEANCLPLGAGACKLCADCTYPNAPCRHPDSAIPSMEAFGLLVADICHDCGLPYSDGRRSLVFSSCLLFGGAMQ